MRQRGMIEIQAEKEASDYDLPPDEFKHPLNISVCLQDTGEYIEADIKLRSFKQAVCDRCLKEFMLAVNADLRLLMIPGNRQRWSWQDDVLLFSPDNPEVDISPHLRDAMMLAAPMKILCKEDCRGLCPGCGADLNYESCACPPAARDERWQALSDLRDKLLRNSDE